MDKDESPRKAEVDGEQTAAKIVEVMIHEDVAREVTIQPDDSYAS